MRGKSFQHLAVISQRENRVVSYHQDRHESNFARRAVDRDTGATVRVGQVNYHRLMIHLDTDSQEFIRGDVLLINTVTKTNLLGCSKDTNHCLYSGKQSRKKNIKINALIPGLSFSTFPSTFYDLRPRIRPNPVLLFDQNIEASYFLRILEYGKFQRLRFLKQDVVNYY